MANKIMTDLSLRIDANSAELKKELQKTNKSFNNFSKQQQNNNEKLKSSFKTIGKTIIAAYSIKQLVSFGKESMKLADIQQKAEAKVKQAIQSTGKAAGLSTEQLKNVASSLQGITQFGDEDILNNVTAQLLTFTNIAGDEFLRTQQVALDLATVLDGDLKSASIQLGKALNDPIKNLSALSRSGIQFSKEQTEIIKTLAKTNRLAEAQSVILTELERQYGGQARAAVMTGNGAFVQLSNTLSDVREKIGAGLIDNLNPLIRLLNDVASATLNNSDALVNERDEINRTVISITGYKEGTDKRKKAIDQLKKAYPDYFGNLDSEKVKNEDLLSQLKDVNKEYTNKIALKEYENQLAKLEKQESRLEKKRIRNVELLRDFSDEYGYGTLSLDELIQKTKEFIKYQNSDKGGQVAKGYLQGLENGVKVLETYPDKYDVIIKKQQKIKENAENLYDLLGYNNNDDDNGGGGDNNGNNNNNNGNDDEIKTTGILIRLNQELNDLKQEYQNATTVDEMVDLHKQITGKEQEIAELKQRIELLSNSNIVKDNAPDKLQSVGDGSINVPTIDMSIDEDFLTSQIESLEQRWNEYYENLKEKENELKNNRVVAIRDYAELSVNAVSTVAQLVEANKQKELSAAGDNAKKREEIEKKYLQKQKNWAIAEAIINGALGVTKAFSQSGILGFVTGALIAASTAAQIATIQAQNFANGGIVYGDTLAHVGEYPGASTNPEVIAPLDKLTNILGNDNNGGGQVRFIIEGDELVGILNKKNKINNIY